MSKLESKVPPMVVVAAFAATMWLSTGVLPGLVWNFPGRGPLAVSLALAGLAFATAGVVAFRRAGTTVNPTTPGAASAMVVSGVYRISRNPMYLGFLLLLAAWAVRLGHPIAFALLPAFALYMNRFQIRPEERALAEKFGDDALGYFRSVPRWL
ncbi:MAG TPA: isoprenylcysteine carboxylmethyltransferase family protein [Candidatus Polarisedimenticolaceae bacterium]|nr:isoprenylcysteine carboxylmethyltransferase family protein [Candidatus Polarisedimenticolaceae bacterium]